MPPTARRTLWVPALGLVVLLVLTVLVCLHTGVTGVDLPVRDWIAAHQVHALHVASTLLTDVVSPPVGLVALLAVGLWRFRDHRWTVIGTAAGLAVVILAMKYAIGRPPPVGPSMARGDFPSGHTASVLVCTGTLLLLSRTAGRRRRVLWAVVIGLTAVVAVSLIYIQAHWVTDVVASLGLGAAMLWAVPVAAAAEDRRRDAYTADDTAATPREPVTTPVSGRRSPS